MTRDTASDPRLLRAGATADAAAVAIFVLAVAGRSMTDHFTVFNFDDWRLFHASAHTVES